MNFKTTNTSHAFCSQAPESARVTSRLLLWYDVLTIDLGRSQAFIRNASNLAQLTLWANMIIALVLSLATRTSLAEEKEAKDAKRAINAVPMRILLPAAGVVQDRGDWFDSWVFGGMSATLAKARLENTLSQRIELLKQQCELTTEQVSKLELAKRGDIARFFQQVDAIRQGVGEQRPDRANMAELSKAISPVQQRWNSGLVTKDSLFVSILKGVLSEDQKDRLSQEGKRRIEERSRFHAMSMIKMIEHSIPLTEKQRQQLLTHVLERTTKVHVDAHFEQYTSLHAATQLSDETLGDFLDATQLATFRQLQKHWETNIPFLNQMVKQPRNVDEEEEWLNVLQ